MRRTWKRPIVAAAIAALVVSCSSGPGDDAAGGAEEAPGAVAAQSTSEPVDAAAQGITVEGRGTIQGQPDTLTTTVGVEVMRDSVQEAIEAANGAAEDVIAAVQEQGVAEEDIQTRDFRVRPDYVHPPDGERELRGYVVTNLLELTIGDVDAAGDVLAAATDAGGDATRIQGVQFSLEDNEALVEAARERAFEDARQRAEQYADLAGRTLGDLVGLEETLTPSSPPRPVPVPDEAARGGQVPVEPGEQDVEIRVRAVWAIE